MIAIVSLLLAGTMAAQACALPSVQASTSAGAIAVGGDVARPFDVSADTAGTYAAVHALVDQPSEAGPIRGEFEGVSIPDLLHAAGPTDSLGKAGLNRATLIATARDGYEVALSYSETDPLLVMEPAFIAFRCNGHAISPTLVTPGDKTSNRYVHELSSIRLVIAK